MPVFALLSAPAFADACAGAAARSDLVWWEHSTAVYERALESVTADLCAQVDLPTRGRALLAVARLALPAAMEQGAAEAADMGFGVFEDNGFDPTAAGQIAALEAWLSEPTDKTLGALRRAVDETRQLQFWDDDVWPAPGEGWPFIIEVTDLMLRAIKQTDAGQRDKYSSDLPVGWPAPEAARRCVVCAHKVLVRDDNAQAAARALLEAMQAASEL